MPDEIKKIVVAGDVTIDWLGWEVAPNSYYDTLGPAKPNWAFHKGFNMVARQGGALLTAGMVRAATGVNVVAPQLNKLESIPPKKVIHSISMLKEFPHPIDKSGKKRVWRVDKFLGFSGPRSGIAAALRVKGKDSDAGLVILDDAGNGFRDDESVWPQVIKGDERPLIILKMSRPLGKGGLWELLTSKHPERLVVVIHADDLRECDVDISRRLSWERTAQDFLWQITNNQTISQLAKCANLIVRFGIEGAIHYSRKDGDVEARLYYDPAHIEGGYRENHAGGMQGLTSAFIAGLTTQIVMDSPVDTEQENKDNGLQGIGKAISSGIKCSRRVFCHGFGDSEKQPDYPFKELLTPLGKEDPMINDVKIPGPAGYGGGDRAFWSILEGLEPKSLESIAYKTVTEGVGSTLERVPIGRFGAFETVDRMEIENFNSIKNLIKEYIEGSRADTPLSIAVFGPPGSGKSFGVTELTKSIAPDRVKRLEFNLAQFESVDDLISSFHKVRDTVLRGMIPLVFFDEFDCVSKDKLGWLKYFLAPMQDGQFKDGETMHPIGKSIFVFAGGTSSSFKEFCCEETNSNECERAKKEFSGAKGPDFLSRLRGYVNIMGPNQCGKNDRFYIIRRAMLLRAVLKKKAKSIFVNAGKADIDPGVVRAMLLVPRYKHGVRSIEAIIDMSMLSDHRKFEQAALPPEEQLEMHVDAEKFSKLVLRDVLFGDALEGLAKAVHERYCEDQKGIKPADHPSVQPWDGLEEQYRQSSLRFAEQIPAKLQRIGYSFFPFTGQAVEKLSFNGEQIEILAQMEHERWCEEKRANGWTYGPERNDPDKKNPLLVKWEELPPWAKDMNRDMVRLIPEHLVKAGFSIYKLL